MPNILLRGKIIDFSSPLVMAIINCTPDSFFAASRCVGEYALIDAVETALKEGADIIDLGGYSTRPGAEFVTPDVEWERIKEALTVIRQRFPQTVISVDTFRASVAECAVKEFDVDIINDISGGTLDDNLLPTVAKLNVPYILMHTRGTPQTMQQFTQYDNLIGDMLVYFSEKITLLRQLGFTSDIIIDPGFGFAKTMDQNYELLKYLSVFDRFKMPILAGVSRKSMVCKLLDCEPSEALNGTTVVNTLALLHGANILRVHDVRQAVEAIKITQKMMWA
ncbi:MAG: dihydropteroate synthase [Prevotellaceae bacterium]|jgi:dihydropteroate synthase|nr:dihydropteroate synthase [Prevotellaceae bacterium]